MNITYNNDTRIFTLRGKDTQYVMQLNGGYLCHVYWGAPKPDGSFDEYMKGLNDKPFFTDNRLESMRGEFPSVGRGDYRVHAFEPVTADGDCIFDGEYAGHRIIDGKPPLEGLPASYADSAQEAKTLEIDLYDRLSDIAVTLSYTVFRDYSVIARSVHVKNAGSRSFRINRLLSAVVDFDSSGFDVILNAGSWINERNLHRQSVVFGNTSISSRTGTSSHAANPMLFLPRSETTETEGDAYGFAFVYSGNFIAGVQAGISGNPRVYMGLNPDCFSWKLEPGEGFTAPEVLMSYSAQGLDGMSREFHNLIRERVCRGKYRDALRPVVANSWEAYWFDLTEDRILALGKKAAQAGIELVVIDDGWFADRRDDTTSLGDWQLNTERFSHGLQWLSQQLSSLGVKLGIWIEPEMVNPQSNLYREHPEWCLQISGRGTTPQRNQYVLDLCNPEVRDFIVDSVSSVLNSADISYIKWDMNRTMTEPGSLCVPADRQLEVMHRYYLGLYEIYERLFEAFPDVLFEGCASGGGRFDCGILHYMPQIWTSDNLDPISRLKIHCGTSMVYPMSCISAHVSAPYSPHGNHTNSMAARTLVSETGSFGYEFNLTALSDAEISEIAACVDEYKQLRPLLSYGDYHRYVDPFVHGDSAWGFVSADKCEAFIVYAAYHAPDPEYTPKTASDPKTFFPYGLDTDKKYTDSRTGISLTGDELMTRGLTYDELTDGAAKAWHLKSE